MIRVEIKGIKEVQARLGSIQRSLQPKVLQPAINKVAAKARAEINRAITSEFAVKVGEVRNAIELRGAQAGRLEAVLTIFGSARKRGRSLNLIHFLAAVQVAGRAAKVKGKKVTKADLAALDRQLGFLIRKAGGIKKIEGAFVGNKGRTIFRRTGNARLPIEPVQVIGFSQMFNSKKINQRVIEKINAEFPKEVDRALAMLLAKGGI